MEALEIFHAYPLPWQQKLHNRPRRPQCRRRGWRGLTAPMNQGGPPRPCLRRALLTRRRHLRPAPAPRMRGGRWQVFPRPTPTTGWWLAASRMAGGRRLHRPTAMLAYKVGHQWHLPTTRLAPSAGRRWRVPMATVAGMWAATLAVVLGRRYRPRPPPQRVKRQAVLLHRRNRGLALCWRQPPQSNRPWRKPFLLVEHPRRHLTLRGLALPSRRLAPNRRLAIVQRRHHCQLPGRELPARVPPLLSQGCPCRQAGRRMRSCRRAARAQRRALPACPRLPPLWPPQRSHPPRHGMWIRPPTGTP